MAYIYDLSDTWNAAGTTFFGIKMNVTNSASASGSKLLSLQVASTEYFGVDKDGNVTIGNGGDLRLSSATGGDASIIYNDAEDLYFNTNGAVRAVINSSGNVGIGTSSPLALLHLNKASGASDIRLSVGGTLYGIAYASSSDFTINSVSAIPLIFGTNNTERMRIDSSGNVGIGTSSPQGGLHINNPVNTKPVIYFSSNTSGSYPTAQATTGSIDNNFSGGAGEVSFWNNQTSAATSFVFRQQTGASARTDIMTLLPSGNVGIGTTSPSSKLAVGGNPPSAGAIGGVASSGGTSLALSDNANSSLYVRHPAGSPATIGTDSGGALAFATNGSTERMRLESGGNILVGTSSAFDNVSYLKFQSFGGVSTKISGTSLTSQMSFFNDNGRVGWIGTDGTITSYNITSDERLKENIADADDASGLIDAIQVRKFDWKANGSHQRYGFIAQELIEVAPEAVSAPDEEDQMMAVDYSKLVPMLIKELQSVRARLAALEGK